jgi:hypothetical protein
MKEIDNTKYEIWNWKNLVMLHWIINPGVSISEFLGVTIPKIMLVEKDKTKSLIERTWIPCPHCDTLHPGIKWSQQNSTHKKNWYGYHCNTCLETIPPLRNWFSAIVFGALKPFNKTNRERWKKAQPSRFENITTVLETKKINFKKGLMLSLFFGSFMFVFMVAFNWLLGETVTTRVIMINAVAWSLGGMVFGFTMRAWGNYQINKVIKNKHREMEI